MREKLSKLIRWATRADQKEADRRRRVRSEAGKKAWQTRRARKLLSDVEKIADRKDSTAFEGGTL